MKASSKTRYVKSKDERRGRGGRMGEEKEEKRFRPCWASPSSRFATAPTLLLNLGLLRCT
jgi:hypothetical protein